MSKLYIVSGTTGEYSDRHDWTVAAYADEAKAQAHAEAAKRWYQATDYFERYQSEWDDAKNPKNPFDPFMSCDYTGTSWSVGCVELRDDLPSEAEPMTSEAA